MLSSGGPNGDGRGCAGKINDGCGGHEVVSAGTSVSDGLAVAGNG